jgi:hypothetical protein
VVREEVKRKEDKAEKPSQDSMKEIVRAYKSGVVEGALANGERIGVPFALESDIQEAIFRMQQECYARENHY